MLRFIIKYVHFELSCSQLIDFFDGTESDFQATKRLSLLVVYVETSIFTYIYDVSE